MMIRKLEKKILASGWSFDCIMTVLLFFFLEEVGDALKICPLHYIHNSDELVT
jgi:hypothetical protein